ncbi:MAG TPA: GGDEF domain-containing protein [Longimicrobiales bacterium]|nr:GGDEF domain-containing protein [Longimicrobiales bacterium]
MSARNVFVYYSPGRQRAPAILHTFAAEQSLTILDCDAADDVVALVNRGYPAGVCVDADGSADPAELCHLLKRDAFSAIVPIVIMASTPDEELVLRALDAGADEVLPQAMADEEKLLRLRMTLRRADRDVSVHPTTRLPGTPQIERDISDRIRRDELFAVCYADLDHFKEFNDRYGYNEGDRVIRMLARLLRDVVKGYSPEGFIGHIGGDDFIFNIALDRMRPACEEILEVFDELIPYQYTEDDRRAGYFLGRDRRGNILWVPIMSLSIGVVTNEHREFTHTGRVSELATEMKTFAKKMPGSVYAVDRRSDASAPTGRTLADEDELKVSTEP